MSINIKQIHIGSHVLVNGNRVRVCGITKRKVGYHLMGKPCERLTYARTCEVEPIPITPTLLEELGFEFNRRAFLYEYEKRWSSTDRFFENNYLLFSLICDDVWRVHLYTNGTFYNGHTVCRYLHEAELFLALHGVELIKE